MHHPDVIDSEGNHLAYIFDIDDTCSEVGERVEELRRMRPDYDKFYARCGEDDPIVPVINIIQALKLAGFRVFFITGRSECCRKQTIEWFRKNHINVKENELYMRSEGDFRSSLKTKPELLQKLINEHNVEIMAIYEDHNGMAKKWRDLGYRCHQVIGEN